MSIEITIPLAPVTKKNSQRILINRKTGTPFVMPSVKYERYQKEAAYYLLRGDQKIKPVEDYPVNVKCLFYMPTHRRVDLTNLLEAVDDLLVHYGVIADDSYKFVAGHDGSRVLYDKENPRTEIYITRVNDILYLCDGLACENPKNCGGEYCHHTHDIEHAKNFERFADTTLYCEKEEGDL